jgi:hypothetical protein
MNLVKLTAAAVLVVAVATPGLAQTPTERPSDAQPSDGRPSVGSPLANDGPYAGTSRQGFYKPDDRIKQIQAEIQQGALAGPKARHALAQLAAIRQDLQFRIARHNGDLRDWDRELINQKLDALVKQYPALRS